MLPLTVGSVVGFPKIRKLSLPPIYNNNNNIG